MQLSKFLQPMNAVTTHSVPGRRAGGASLLAIAVLWLGFFSFQAAAEDLPAAAKPASAGVTPMLPASVDLRPSFEKWGLPVLKQGKRGTCSVFTVAGALEFAAASKLQHGERFSVEFLNWGANKMNGEKDDGSFFSDLWSGFATYGACLEKTLPYRAEFDPTLAPSAEVLTEAKAQLALGLRHHWIKEWNVKTGLTEAEFLAVKRTLNQGWPVCGGFRWPKQPKWTDGVLGMCPADAVYDGHSVLLVGYRDDASQPGGGVFLFRNSNKDGPAGSMPYTYARAYMNDAIWIESDAPAPPAS